MHIPFTKKKPLATVILTSQQQLLTIKCQRLFLWLLIIPITLLSACSAFNANAYNYSILPEHVDSHYMRINILNSFLLTPKTYQSIPITELSDLGWDQDEQLLYAVSDEGYLYHLKLEITNNKLQSVAIVYATQLKNKAYQALKGKFSDAEGLTVQHGNNGKRGDSELIISFENKPRIAIYSNHGDFIKKVKTAKKLRKRKYSELKIKP